MTDELSNRSITDRTYWESYYSTKEANTDEVKKLGHVYDKYWPICINSQTKSVIEIGAFPGRYLAYVAKTFDLRPTALDYQSDLTTIAANFRALGIEEFDLLNEDFLDWDCQDTFDFVMSIGFVEHFTNFEDVIAKHCAILNKGGAVFFQIPNKRLLRWLYGCLADRSNLAAHNLNVMSLDVFRQAAVRNNMTIEVLEYFGPFQFGLHGANRNALRLSFFHLFRIVFKKLKLNSVVERFPSRFWSASIICVMRRRR